jgi:hypothetical protein
MFEALLSSVSAHSRFLFLLHGGPYWLVIAERWPNFRSSRRRIVIPLLTACFVLLLWLSLSTVSRIRFQEYFEMPQLPPEYSAARYYGEVVDRQLARLFIQRWVGLEGALAAISAPDRGSDLLRAALTDDARLGAESFFQKAAKVSYASPDPARFTFLTTPAPLRFSAFRVLWRCRSWGWR